MTEGEYQNTLLDNPLFHVSRNYNQSLNLATAQDANGTVGASVAGPDGEPISAVQFNAPNLGWSDTLTAALSGDFCAKTFVKATGLTVYPFTLMTIGILNIRIVEAGGVYSVQYDDGITTQSVQLAGSRTDWELIAVIRKDQDILVCQNKTFIGTFELLSLENYGTAFSAFSSSPSQAFDTIVLPRVVGQNALEYYYDQVLKNTEAVLQPF